MKQVARVAHMCTKASRPTWHTRTRVSAAQRAQQVRRVAAARNQNGGVCVVQLILEQPATQKSVPFSAPINDQITKVSTRQVTAGSRYTNKRRQIHSHRSFQSHTAATCRRASCPATSTQQIPDCNRSATHAKPSLRPLVVPAHSALSSRQLHTPPIPVDCLSRHLTFNPSLIPPSLIHAFGDKEQFQPPPTTPLSCTTN